MLDCSELTWEQMADIVRAIFLETKRRNPIGVNMYAPTLQRAYGLLEEISEAEQICAAAVIDGSYNGVTCNHQGYGEVIG